MFAINSEVPKLLQSLQTNHSLSTHLPTHEVLSKGFWHFSFQKLWCLEFQEFRFVRNQYISERVLYSQEKISEAISRVIELSKLIKFDRNKEEGYHRLAHQQREPRYKRENTKIDVLRGG